MKLLLTVLFAGCYFLCSAGVAKLDFSSDDISVALDRGLNPSATIEVGFPGVMVADQVGSYNTWPTIDLSEFVGTNSALVMVYMRGAPGSYYNRIRQSATSVSAISPPSFLSESQTSSYGYFWLETTTNGTIQVVAELLDKADVWLVAYISPRS